MWTLREASLSNSDWGLSHRQQRSEYYFFAAMSYSGVKINEDVVAALFAPFEPVVSSRRKIYLLFQDI